MNSACIHLTCYFPSAAVINILGLSTFLASSVFAGMCLYSIYGHLDRFQILIRSLLLLILLLDVNSFIIYVDPDSLTSAVNAVFGDGRTVRLRWPSWIIFSSGVQWLSQVKLALFFLLLFFGLFLQFTYI